MLNQYLNGQKVINKQQTDTINNLRNHICDVPDTVFVTKPIGPTIGFTINSAEIDQRHEMNIINIAKEYGDKKIVVKGYADAATGTPEYNMELSGKRAEAVKRLLIKHGVKEENITTKAEGGQINLNPFYTSDYMNRCVLFTIE
jgi:outer membrane protein OmpA-like peptidoglycan-associated protein